MHFHFPFKSVQALIPVIIVISMCLLVACTGDQYAEKIGSVPNPSFEVAEGDRPAEWQERGSRRGGGTLGYENIGRTGTKSVMISSEERTTMSWRTSVPVKLYSQYRLSGWIKTENGL